MESSPPAWRAHRGAPCGTLASVQDSCTPLARCDGHKASQLRLTLIPIPPGLGLHDAPAKQADVAPARGVHLGHRVSRRRSKPGQSSAIKLRGSFETTANSTLALTHLGPGLAPTRRHGGGLHDQPRPVAPAAEVPPRLGLGQVSHHIDHQLPAAQSLCSQRQSAVCGQAAQRRHRQDAAGRGGWLLLPTYSCAASSPKSSRMSPAPHAPHCPAW